MSDSNQFRKATRRLLFPEPIPSEQEIPGAGSSAAESSERHTKVKITINLDGEVIQHFKDLAREEGRPYQSLINQVLREYIAGSRPERLRQQLRELLSQDEHFIEEIARRVAER